MKPFLSLVAHDLYTKLQGDLSHTVVVFPGKRAGLFFNQYLLSEHGGKPLFAPTYMTLSELFASLTSLQTDDTIRLVCLLHRSFVECTAQQESIDNFYGWGELLLSDFDDIDKNLVETDSLFSNLENYKELSTSTDYLTDEQKEVLKKFFDGFTPTTSDSKIRKNFLRIWEAMAPIYKSFRAGLEAEGRAYEGQLFRHAVEHFDAARLKADRYVFVGFNVLSAVERRLFDLVDECGKAMFYWDYDHYYYDNPAAEAGTFVRINIQHYGNELDEDASAEAHPYDNLSRLPRMDVVSAPTDSAQAAYVHGWLKENLTENGQETAVVLADEKLAIPVLHALPMDEIHDINVTMGLPMTETSVFQFLSDLIQEPEDNVLQWLRHIAEAIDSKGLEMKQLDHRLQEEEEALYRAHLAVNSLIRLVDEGTLTGTAKLISRLLMTILRGTTIPFHGEPAKGLQVMGVLETRNLDFRHLLLLSANEGMLPKPPSEVSFIPFSLRKAFGLTTIERQTAVYAYYFYRMIQRAEKVTLVYNNGTDGLSKKDPTRFITQLEVEFKGDVRHFALQSDSRPATVATIIVEQTDEARKRLAEHFSKYSLSPTAIKDFFNCKLKFYLKYVQLLEHNEVDDQEVTRAQFGVLFHRSAELAYKRLTEAGPRISKKDLDDLANNEVAIQELVHQAFLDEYWKTELDEEIHYSGIHFINFNTICIYLKRLLRTDAQRAPFIYVDSELRISRYLQVPTRAGDIRVRLGGIIDRLDSNDGILRIIDYKTGGKEESITTIGELFDPNVKTRKAYVFQSFYYSWLLCWEYEEKGNTDYRLSPGLCFVNHRTQPDYDPTVKYNNVRVTDFRAQVFDEFDSDMKDMLKTIFDSDEPYVQVDDVNKCRDCDFCAICGRKPKNYW